MAGFVKNAAAGAAQNLLATNPTDQWSTTMFQCTGVAPVDWALACCCTPCAAAKAKSNADQSHPCYNFLCWTPLGGYSYTRLGYGIMGECGTDCMAGLFCMPCSTRQMLTEFNVRGSQPGHFGGASREWHSSHWACSCTELCFAAVCPCCVTHTVRAMIQPEADQWFDYCCVLPTSTYGLVRNTYGLEVGMLPDMPCVEDIFYGGACYPCALARSQREAAWQRANQAAGDVGGALGGVAGAVKGIGNKLTGAIGGAKRSAQYGSA